MSLERIRNVTVCLCCGADFSVSCDDCRAYLTELLRCLPEGHAPGPWLQRAARALAEAIR